MLQKYSLSFKVPVLLLVGARDGLRVHEPYVTQELKKKTTASGIVETILCPYTVSVDLL